MLQAVQGALKVTNVASQEWRGQRNPVVADSRLSPRYGLEETHSPHPAGELARSKRYGDTQDSPYRCKLDDGFEALIIDDARLLQEATNDPVCLVSGKEWYLCLKIHLSITTLAPSGREMRRQVPLPVSALY